ncbi:hypothetical protein G6F70_005031 [Rhizopus microsporus]|uniref:DNA topoisomerase I n=2 Tax=Rhizopus TaxID=4842 RepID=A0A367KDZ1_RHIAZ|nr:hypothetical protein G6F71_004606 [Rhizopus microsporus]KAG1199328.1 hypothetical protein G6F70_005031 [Rhizopus microsporus]KAG1211142.1 hypothetical protein G6F69_004858 [Rhizopus microsporus]ORE16532.1 hypothetical protein BCV71DRAFT_228023 [Rhizopus microsporus]RCI00435.1 DNA topoisomerase 1 [Rhizopus azygosporus]
MSAVLSDDEIPLAQRVKVGNQSNPSLPEPRVEKNEQMNGESSLKESPVKAEDSDDEDDIPLAQRMKKSPIKTEDSDDEDDIPLSQRLQKKANGKLSPVKKETNGDHGISIKEEKVKPEPMEVDMPSKKRPLEKSASTSTKNTKAKKKAKKEEEEEDIYKWWEEQDQSGIQEDDSIKWTTLEHNGVMFPPDYVPHGVKMKYDGKPITLSPEAEEVATFFANILESEHAQNPVFQKNFFNDWLEVLRKDPSNPKITDFNKCDFRPIWEKLQRDKEAKKQMSKEEKQRLKEEKKKIEEPYQTAIVDGRREKVGNFKIEPPELFRGRGNHPKTGKLKMRVQPEQVTLNLGKDAKIPEPPKGHKWGGIVHDQTATWLATWKENVNGNIKYVFLAATSAWKGQSDMKKFEKARELKNCVAAIRENYTKELKDKVSEIRQRATAMYLIDRLALRAGNEKGEDEADTVGCCSLRYEHIELEPPNILHFDFLGKDSIRYQNTVEVDAQVFKNIKLFKKQVGPGHMIFDRLTPNGLNKHLNNYMKGLSAKVFRTYNASITFQQQLDKMTNPDDSIHDKLLSYNRANREVAVLCNHQRTASKNHEQQISKIEDRIRALKYQRMKLRKTLYAADPKMKKNPKYADPESDLEEEWMIQHEADLVTKEKERIKTRFQKQNEKLAAKGEPQLEESELTKSLKAADALLDTFAKERKAATIEPKNSMTADKLIARIEKIDERIAATKVQATDKEENKQIALNTSKLNYIDPRISVAWCRKYNIPLEKVFSKTLIEKFRWAQKIPDDWKF